VDQRIARLERDVERLAGEVQKVRDQIGDLHNNSMAFVTATFAEMEHRIMDKMEVQGQQLSDRIDTATRGGASERLLILSGAFGWVLTLGIVILQAVHH
jgi:hypothetical protein